MHPSILITDDDLGFRETLRGIFEPRGFRTHLAADGEEAVEIVRHQEIHLVLLDMHMPKLTGLETIRLVKRLNAVLPCILMSARADEMLVREALDAQAFSVLPKPFSQRTISMTVRNAFEQTYRVVLPAQLFEPLTSELSTRLLNRGRRLPPT